jgi:hypothetical protein
MNWRTDSRRQQIYNRALFSCLTFLHYTQLINCNTIVKLYSLEYTEIDKVSVTPIHTQ